MSLALVALGLFALLAGLLAIGAPVAVALGLSALLAVAAAAPEGTVGLVNVLFGVPMRPTLLPVPLFITVGLVLAESSLIRRAIDLADRLFGGLPGGLGVVTVVAGIFFAGISGSGPADVAALGTVLIPALVQSGMPRPRAAALLAACGGLGIVVPPSIALILYAFVAQTAVQGWSLAHPEAVVSAPSIERLFLAGLLPGVLLGVAVAAVVVWRARRSPRRRALSRLADVPTATLALRALPGLAVPVLILGGIYAGLFTATQAAAVATLCALALELLVYREMSLRRLGEALWQAGRTTAQVMILVGCASMFSTALVHLQLQEPAVRALGAFAGSRVIYLLAINALVLVLGMFIDAISILFIAVPILLPPALALGIDPVHLGVVLTVNLAIGQITPPVGVNLFVAASVAGERLGKIIGEVWAFVAAEVAVLLLITLVPALTLA